MKNAAGQSTTVKHITPSGIPRLLIVLVIGACMILMVSVFNNSSVSTVLAIAFVLVWIPVFLLTVRDRLVRKRAGLTADSRVQRALYSCPDILLGSFSLVFGLMMIIWVLYNVFLRRLPEYTGPSIVDSLGSFGIGVPLLLYGLDRIRSALHSGKSARKRPQEPD
ncbi:MAG TPA: hypothetical protein VFA48_12555 [Gammaproteobacteria bacterium]|nr:hypothetical protein [Gammaproteobacteria bacterium]